MAYESLAMINTALSRLECGKIGILRYFNAHMETQIHMMYTSICYRFGEHSELLHTFDEPFTVSTGAHILQHLSFSQSRTNFAEVGDCH